MPLIAAKTIRVPMGGLKFGESPDVMETLLGSCVGIAIWDERSGCAGLAHAMLPESNGNVGLPGKFVDTAVALLKQTLMKNGANLYSLRAKMTGGSVMFGSSAETVGERNCEAVREQLKKNQIRLVAEHIGGEKGRVVRFCLKTRAIEVEISRKVVAVI